MIVFPGAGRPLPGADLRRRREQVVREHMTTEMAGDLDACLATMPGGADYAIKPLGRDHHGDDEVRELLTGLLTAFPDLRLVPTLVHHAADALIVEGRTVGTQAGDWAGIPSKGLRMDVEGCVVFRFDGDRLTNETVYYDHAAVVAQLTGER